MYQKKRTVGYLRTAAAWWKHLKINSVGLITETCKTVTSLKIWKIYKPTALTVCKTLGHVRNPLYQQTETHKESTWQIAKFVTRSAFPLLGKTHASNRLAHPATLTILGSKVSTCFRRAFMVFPVSTMAWGKREEQSMTSRGEEYRISFCMDKFVDTDYNSKRQYISILQSEQKGPQILLELL